MKIEPTNNWAYLLSWKFSTKSGHTKAKTSLWFCFMKMMKSFNQLKMSKWFFNWKWFNSIHIRKTMHSATFCSEMREFHHSIEKQINNTEFSEETLGAGNFNRISIGKVTPSQAIIRRRHRHRRRRLLSAWWCEDDQVARCWHYLIVGKHVRKLKRSEWKTKHVLQKSERRKIATNWDEKRSDDRSIIQSILWMLKEVLLQHTYKPTLHNDHVVWNKAHTKQK